MNRVYLVKTLDGEVVATHRRRKTLVHFSLGEAKNAIKTFIAKENRFLFKDKKLHYNQFRIHEYELVEKDLHYV